MIVEDDDYLRKMSFLLHLTLLFLSIPLRFKTICLRDVALIVDVPVELTIESMGSNSKRTLVELGNGLGVQQRYRGGRRGLSLAQWWDVASTFIVTCMLAISEGLVVLFLAVRS